jgi:hypothetical protein
VHNSKIIARKVAGTLSSPKMDKLIASAEKLLAPPA